MLKQAFLITVLSCMGSSPVLAHVMWFPPGQGGYKLWMSEFTETESEEYDPNGPIAVKAYDFSKNLIPTSIDNATVPISIVPGQTPAAITVAYDSGFWIRDDAEGIDVEHEMANYLGYLTPQEQEARGYDTFVHQLKYTQTLYDGFNPSENFGLPLEIVPLSDPFTLNGGDTLPIKVLFGGQYVNDATILYLDTEQTVDSNGIAYIPIGSKGLQPIEVDYSTPGTANTPLTYYATSFTTGSNLSSTSVPEPSSLIGLGIIGLGLCLKKRC
ncbi:MAG: hypothetical protein N5P05_001349 [Chroococcopsis gigantea SAG 12.99]|nr:DUF4198 domain-containing protein [Chlorogloea purpurea SAG 13.99]MDV2999743.1 hypothetical protein [Chroococcopsis gigantea SAG 12.99]